MRLSDWCSPLLAVTLCLGGLDASAEDAAPPAPGALSYLKPVAPKKCEWVRQPLPSGPSSTLLAFDQPCSWASLAWSPDGRQGLVSTLEDAVVDPENVKPIDPKKIPVYHFWLVDLAEKKSTPLDTQGLLTATAKAAKDAAAPVIYDRGFDAQGHPVVILALIYSASGQPIAEDNEGKSLLFEGKGYPAPAEDGWPGLALAYRWTGAKWERFELKATTYHEEGSRGTDVLKATKVLAAFKPHVLEDLPGKKAAPALVKILDTTLKQKQAGHWRTLSSPGATLLYRAENWDTNQFSARAPVRWVQSGELSEVEQLPVTARDHLGFQLQGSWLAITVGGENRSSSAYVYDTQTKKLLVSVPETEGARLWP
jgi:hypothetical protein